MGKAASLIGWCVDRPRRVALNLLAGCFVALPAVTSEGLADPVTVVALGDSLTHGYGLVPEDGFVPQMQRYLEANGSDAVLINAGVSGDTTAGGASRIDWTLTEDVDAVIVALGSNDMLRGLPPDTARDNLDTILSKVSARGLPVLLVGVDAPSNYGAEYEAAFEAIYPDLSAKYQTLSYPHFFEGLAEIGDLSVVMAKHMQSDGIHPNASGVAIIVEAMGPAVLDLINTATD